MEKDLLLGEETRELEILEFRAGGNSYGVDVNDIRELLPYDKDITPVPNAHPYIEGIIMPRDFLIPIVDIVKSLKLNESDENKNEMIMVTSINDQNIAFHVDSLAGIHRTTNKAVTKPGKKLSTSMKEAVIGILDVNNKKVEILELRNIITYINPELKF
ncbi:purine-binding chemotaxis protein CheW [Mobilitalea sibirica]|uniref:Purine-binding chemotaxis protein CheW n=1 Tax=Mobilitalea sibirica TaxID=1462919 RepID=A0A8J7H4T9_9FIRM|nr:chemotaxis protein CheW [Mobilitalea sibirica]MBH1939676.1 purine-binding chemotaxis protein CheW [Mobilitalea sibirica]